MNPDPLDSLSDAALLARACEQSGQDTGRRAASILLQRYHRQVFRWCQSQLRDRDRALDAAQEVLLSAYRNLDGFGERARFSSWLYAIARNRCLSELRRPGLLRDESGADERLPDGAAPPEAALEREQGEAAIRSLLRRHLTPVEQEVLWLRSQERMPVEEITRALNLSGATGARGVLQSARRKLRDALERSPRARKELGDA